MLTRDNGQLFKRLGTTVIQGVGKDNYPSVWAGNDMKHGIVDNLNVRAAFPEGDAGWADRHINARHAECSSICRGETGCGSRVRVRCGNSCCISDVAADDTPT